MEKNRWVGEGGNVSLSPFPPSLSMSSLYLHFPSLSVSSFSIHFLSISSFSPHFLAARLQGCNRLRNPVLNQNDKSNIYLCNFFFELSNVAWGENLSDSAINHQSLHISRSHKFPFILFVSKTKTCNSRKRWQSFQPSTLVVVSSIFTRPPVPLILSRQQTFPNEINGYCQHLVRVRVPNWIYS